MLILDRTAVSLIVGIMALCNVGTHIDLEGEESEGKNDECGTRGEVLPWSPTWNISDPGMFIAFAEISAENAHSDHKELSIEVPCSC